MAGTPSPNLIDNIRFLQELQHELNTQEIDCQANPRFWVIGDYELMPCREGDEDENHVLTGDRDPCSIDELLKDIESDDLPDYSLEAQEQFKLLAEANDDEKLDWILEHYDSDAEMVPVKKQFIIRQNTMFLTKAEAQKHLELNHYHYSKEAHTYAMTAWRAPKVARLLDILQQCDWGRVAELLGEGGQ